MPTPYLRPLRATTCLLVVLLLGAASPARALDHAGILAGDETWLAADNPHVLTSHVTVQAGRVLTLEPGVQVTGNPGIYLYVYGALIAAGAPGQEISLDRSAASGYWGGLVFAQGGQGSLHGVAIANAVSGIALNSGAWGSVDIAEVSISGCSYGINQAGGSVTLASTSISGAATTGIFGNSVAPVVLDAACEVSGCAVGLQIAGVAGLDWTAELAIRNCTSAGLRLQNCLGASLDNLTFTGNVGSHGAMLLDGCGDVTLGAGNVIGGAGGANSWPVSLGAGSYLVPGSAIPTAGNTNNAIRLAGGGSAVDGTLQRMPGLDYVLAANPQLLYGSDVTIGPGVTIRANTGTYIYTYGTLTVAGTADEPVLLDRNGTTGGWGGLVAGSSGSISLAHARIAHASQGVQSQTGSGMITLADCRVDSCGYGLNILAGGVSLASTTIFGSTTVGVHCTATAPVLADTSIVIAGGPVGLEIQDVADLAFTAPMAIRDCTTSGMHIARCENALLDNLVLTGNTGLNGALHLENCGDVTLGAGNVIGGAGGANSWPVSLGAGSFLTAGSIVPTAGNTNDAIRLATGNSNRTGSWRRFPGLDYVLAAAPQVTAGGTVTIEPGVTVRANAGCTIYAYGELVVAGTAEEPVTLTRNDGAAGWSGIIAGGSGNVTLDHADVSFASYAVFSSTTGTVAVTDSRLHDNATGLWATNGTVALVRTRIDNNTNYGIYLVGATPVFGSSLAEWNDILDNGPVGQERNLRNGATDVAAPFVFWGSMNPTTIRAGIIDREDYATLGAVDFLQWTDASHSVTLSAVGDDAPGAGAAARFALAQNAPNPFNPATVIAFELARPSHVRLEVFDVAGARVAVVADGPLPAGRHARTWRGADDAGRAVASGVYFYRLTSDEGVLTRRMLLLR